MKLRLLILFLTFVLPLGAVAIIDGVARSRSAEAMADGAKNFLAALTPEQRAKAVFKFEDEQRLDWHFIPRPRQGVPLKELNPKQQKLAHDFLKTGLSQRAYVKATTIMELDIVLRELEKGSGPTRDPELYYFTVFGTPSAKDPWGWRVEGHHISLNFTIIKGEMVATTPSFFGANPAEVRQGPRQGLRVLAAEEDLGRELLLSLNEKQRAQAIFEQVAPRDIITMNSKKADPLAPVGIPARDFNSPQTERLKKLLDEYISRMPSDLAAERWAKLQRAGLEKVHFAWAGSGERNQPHYYRLQGPTFLVEYDDTQNNANHIHTVWRDFDGDFGRDLLHEHYQSTPHPSGQSADAAPSKTMSKEGIANADTEAIVKPLLTHFEKGRYTLEACRNRVEGGVLFSVLFTAKGQITNIKVEKPLPDGLTEKAFEAVKKVRFKPATKDGKPVDYQGHIEINFALDPNEPCRH